MLTLRLVAPTQHFLKRHQSCTVIQRFALPSFIFEVPTWKIFTAFLGLSARHRARNTENICLLTPLPHILDTYKQSVHRDCKVLCTSFFSCAHIKSWIGQPQMPSDREHTSSSLLDRSCGLSSSPPTT